MTKQFLNFKKANCKNCYKCLRECPVKAIQVIGHQAKILDDKCILCGKCTHVCHQNAKEVVSGLEGVLALLSGDVPVVASVAPSFISNFEVKDFSTLKNALKKLGFSDAEETARGAASVVEEYKKLLESGKYKNLIASACPSVVRLIQVYYPAALQYLAMVDSPMVAHAKILKKERGVKVVFIGPCIAKKREAADSGVVDGVLTFEELDELITERKISLKDCEGQSLAENLGNRAKYFPVNRGIIKSFPYYPKGYEYISVDGADRCKSVLDNIDTLEGVFLEMNTCEFSCINGPCKVEKSGGTIKATETVRAYVKEELFKTPAPVDALDLFSLYPKIQEDVKYPTEEEITEILAKTGKYTKEQELDCGACGYRSCREKAWAVYNGLAELEMCVPFMRERAESMSFEIIKNSPNGIVSVDSDLKVIDINDKGKQLLGISGNDLKGRLLVDFFSPVDFFNVLESGKNILNKRIPLDKTDNFAELSVVLVKEQKMMFGILKDITEDERTRRQLAAVKKETVETANRVVEKQMRVVQEIASLLGETTAETKIALVKLKNTLMSGEERV